MADTEMTDYATFVVKGKDQRVPAMTFYTFEENRQRILDLAPDLDWLEYAKQVLWILVRVMEPDDLEKQSELFQAYRRDMSIPETRALTSTLSDLLRISGFMPAEPTEEPEAPPAAANLGTGTPTQSQLN